MIDLNLLKRKLGVFRKSNVPVKIRYEHGNQSGIGELIDIYNDDETVFLIKTESGSELLLSSEECVSVQTENGIEIRGGKNASKKKDNQDTRKRKL